MTSTVQATSSILNWPCCAPVRWVCAKVKALAEAIFGYLLRVVTFQLGVMKSRAAYWIMRIYQRLLSDPREQKPFDHKRLEDSKNLLTRFGGVEAIVQPADGGSQVHCMILRSADFFETFRKLGSQTIDIIHEGRPRKALLNPPPEAHKFSLPIIEIKMPDGTVKEGALLREGPDTPRKPMILYCHSPGQSMAMARKYLGHHLGAGYDVTIWDYRGTAESTGTPSEGGYYLDGEAVFQHVLKNGFAPNRIYIYGFCEGAAVAAHLKRKFHHLGVHFIAGNPYTSMKDVVEGFGWLGRLAARYGLKALQDPNINVPQDGFDNVAKFRNLPRSTGKFILLDTDPDTMMPRGTVQKLIGVIDQAGPTFQITRTLPTTKGNYHTQQPHERCETTWRRYVQVVA